MIKLKDKKGFSRSSGGGLEKLFGVAGGAAAGTILAGPGVGTVVGGISGLALAALFRSVAFTLFVGGIIFFLILTGGNLLTGIPWWVVVGLILLMLLFWNRKK
jgi:hypothetical protein